MGKHLDEFNKSIDHNKREAIFKDEMDDFFDGIEIRSYFYYEKKCVTIDADKDLTLRVISSVDEILPLYMHEEGVSKGYGNNLPLKRNAREIPEDETLEINPISIEISEYDIKLNVKCKINNHDVSLTIVLKDSKLATVAEFKWDKYLKEDIVIACEPSLTDSIQKLLGFEIQKWGTIRTCPNPYTIVFNCGIDYEDIVEACYV
jgi:hypothetical protein